MFGRLLPFLSSDVAVDLGTTNTLINLKDHGIVLREPSVVAVKDGSSEVLAAGDEAKRMLGRTPQNIRAVRPLRDGVVADVDIARDMLRAFLQKALPGRISKMRMIVSVPSGITEVEKKAVQQAAQQASNAREIHLLEEPMAAAIGVGLPVQEAAGNMIIDIGGGTTEIALLSLSGIVFSRATRVGGDDMDEAIQNYLRRAYGLSIGERTAEEIKMRIGSAAPLKKELGMDVKGLELISGVPKTIQINSAEIRDALEEPLRAIIQALRTALERCPPELSGDLVDRGVMLAGGGALLREINTRLSRETGLPVHTADDPLSAVADGAGKVLDELVFLKKVTSMDG
ncbi:MAG: rod shape-determining protein [Verrucomicrobiota bacterium]